MKNGLYYFISEPEGENYGLFVRAPSVERAIDMWREFFGIGMMPDKVILLEANVAGEEGALPWDTLTIAYGPKWSQ